MQSEPTGKRFELIPVLDIMQGVVVRAIRGDRANYQPIVSPLARSPTLESVVAGFLGLYPFKRFYIADLGAIMQRGDHRSQLHALAGQFTDREFWIDAGVADSAALLGWRRANVRPVVGTETSPSLEFVAAHRGDIALSLDLRTGQALGNAALHRDSSGWPDQIICMTLERVGSHAGPDFDRLAALVSDNPGRAIYAAGGVRDLSDLQRLRALGVAGALVASALHDQTLSSADLAALMSTQ